MKKLYVLSLVFFVVFSTFSFAENKEEEAVPVVTALEDLKVEEIAFENLPKESKVGNLEEIVKEEDSVFDHLMQRAKKKKILYPYSEAVAYVNGQLCLISHYPQSIIYTVLEGPNYGLQTVTTLSGAIIYVNYDYDLKYTPFGVILYHYYPDSQVQTGANQAIKFY